MVGRGISTHFVRRYWVSEVEYLDMPARGPDYEHLVLDVHGVTSFLELHSSQRGGRSEVPILGSGGVFPSVSDHVLGKKKGGLNWMGKRMDLYLERFVPATCGKDPSLRHFKPLHALDRTFMLSYLCRCAG